MTTPKTPLGQKLLEDVGRLTLQGPTAALAARISEVEAQAAQPWRMALQEVVDQWDTYGVGVGLHAALEHARSLLTDNTDTGKEDGE